MPDKSIVINLRCKAELKYKIKTAADLEDKSLSTFILTASVERARRILTDNLPNIGLISVP